MKFFHLSDLHIGLKLYERDLSEDQKFIFEEILNEVRLKNPDAILIAGDIYDRSMPAAESVELFDFFISSLHQIAPDCAIMMISGNHDSADRVNLFRNVLKDEHIYMIGKPPQRKGEHIEKVVLHDEYGPVNFYLLPFVHPSLVRSVVNADEDGSKERNLSYDETIHRLIAGEDIDTNERNVLLSHQFYFPAGSKPEDVERTEIERRTVGNIDAVRSDVLKLFDYAALGHIHRPMKVGSERWRYSGTPLACSLSEEGQKKGIVYVKLKEKGIISIDILPLKPKHELRTITGKLEEVLRQPSFDYVRVKLTDDVEMDAVEIRDRIKNAFPNYLEIRHGDIKPTYLSYEFTDKEASDALTDPLMLCEGFLGGLDEDEKEILRDVINFKTEER